jgi:hypothetical protein
VQARTLKCSCVVVKDVSLQNVDSEGLMKWWSVYAGDPCFELRCDPVQIHSQSFTNCDAVPETALRPSNFNIVSALAKLPIHRREHCPYNVTACMEVMAHLVRGKLKAKR